MYRGKKRMPGGTPGEEESTPRWDNASELDKVVNEIPDVEEEIYKEKSGNDNYSESSLEEDDL